MYINCEDSFFYLGKDFKIEYKGKPVFTYGLVILKCKENEEIIKAILKR
jgi:hypothetical protein